MGGSNGVRLQSFQRFEIRTPHDWLRGEMEDQLGPDFGDYAGQSLEISNVTFNFAGKSVRFDDFVKIGIGWGRQTDSPNFRAQAFEPEGEPSTFKSSVACDQHSFALVKGFVHETQIQCRPYAFGQAPVRELDSCF